MESKNIVIGENDNLIQMSFYDSYVEFIIFEIDFDSMHEQLKGTIKWDGCSNVESDTCMHFCDPSDFMYLFEAMRVAYNEAAKYFNDKKIEGHDELPMWGE